MKFSIKGIGQAITRSASKAGLKLKVHSPQILVIGGVVGLVAAGIIACKQTPKAMKINEQKNDQIEAVKKALTGEMVPEDGSEFTEKDAKHETKVIYMQAIRRYVKCYGPAVVLATLSIVSILGGFRILNGRYVATAATLAGVENKFAQYRDRVKEELGAEKENLIFTNSEKKPVKAYDLNKQTGEVEEVIRDGAVVKNFDINDPYCFIFDSANAPYTWNRTPGYNYMFLTKIQCDLNERLKAKGYLTLNQVLEALGMQPVDHGLVAGWLADDPGVSVEFNICHGNGRLAAGDDPGCWSGGTPDYVLFFNCRGNIQQGLGKKKKNSYREQAAVVC